MHSNITKTFSTSGISTSQVSYKMNKFLKMVTYLSRNPRFRPPPHPPECFEVIASFSGCSSPFGWACFRVVVLAPEHGRQVSLSGGLLSILLSI